MTQIIMSQKEIDRYDIIKRLIRREIKEAEAAVMLKLSTRQIRRLKQKVKINGAKGLIHDKRGKPSNNQIPSTEKEKIKKLLKKYYPDFNPGLATEKLVERHKINRDPKTIRQIMIDEGLWKPGRKKTKDKHRLWRERKTCYGEMQQFDGSYHNWFEERAPKCCLLASIDDATSIITKAKFDFHEGVFPVFDFWKDYVKINGKPRSIYVDKFSTYRMHMKDARENSDTLTRFGRAMEELHIEHISANSSQAKGRIERLFKTLQNRLVKEMRLEKINNMDEANRFLNEIFIPKFNAKFAVAPASKSNLHKKLSSKEKKNLDSIFSRQHERTINNDFTISFNKQWFQIIEGQPVTVFKRDKVIIEERLTGDLCIRLRGKYLNYLLLPERPKKINIKQWVIPTGPSKLPKNKKKYQPPSDHPWRKFSTKSLTQNYAK